MADTTALKNRIRAAIKANDNQEITGLVLQTELIDIVDELNQGTENETYRAQGAEANLGKRIGEETLRAQGAETSLSQAINQLIAALDTMTFSYNTPAAQQATRAMLDVIITVAGNPHTLSTLTLGSATTLAAGLMSAVDKQKLDAILTNLRSLRVEDITSDVDLGNKIVESLKITIEDVEETISTFQLLTATASKAGLLSAADKAKLDALWSSGYQFAGIATPSTTPISTTLKIFYFATEAGTYFNAVTVTQGINIIYKSGDTWSVAQVVGIDDEPTAGSDNLVKSGGVAEVLSKNIDITNDLIIGALPGYIERNGTITAYATWHYKTFLLKKGQTITVVAATGDYPKLGIAQSGTVEVGDVVTVVSGNSYTASSDTWIVVSEGSKLLSAIITESTNIFQTADNTPDYDSENIVSSKGIANALKNVRVDGHIKQESSLLLYKAGLSYKLNTNLSAKNGDTIIVTLTDNDNVLPSGYSMALYHGDPGDSAPYTNITVGVPTEITLNLDVNNFFLYVITSDLTKTGYIALKLDYKDIYDELADDVDVLKTKCEIPFDSIVSLNKTVSFAYDSGITIQAGQEIEMTLIDEGGIVIEDSLPLYRNSISGSYVNLVPGVPTKIVVSEQTHFLLYVKSSWISASGNVTLHVEYINTSDIIDVTLPSKAYAYVGGEFNIYNENVAFITQKDRYYIFWSIENINDYKVYSDRLRILPTSDMIGTHKVTLQVLDRFNNSVIYSKSFTLEIVANTPVTNKKVLFIGDSLTNAGYYPHFVEYLSNNGIQSIGTRESEVWSSFVEGRRDIVHHEGRGGWSAMDYVRNYAEYRTDAPNPFWNPSTNKFDFSYYMTQQGYSKPDAVFINLGTNLVYFLAGTINATKEMITSIHAYDSTIPIFVSLIIPPATQEGRAYSGHGDSHVFEKDARNQRKEYIKEFEDKLANVYVSPVYFNLDRYYDFPTVEEPVSQRNTTTVVRQTDGTHPRRFGYYKMGDVYYANIMKVLSA